MAQAYDMNLVKLVEDFGSDERCRAYLEQLRWPDGVLCPRCGPETNISTLANRDQFQCEKCQFQFSVTSGTIMHDTHLPLWKWFLAVYMIIEAKKGVSANQLKRTIRVSYKTAWYLCHRIRKALEVENGPLKGTVEIDGTFVGGKAKTNRNKNLNKTLVIGAVERGGEVRLQSKGKRQAETIHNVGKFVRANIAEGVTVYTDGGTGYPPALKDRNRHERVNHISGEYVRSDVHCNSVEGVFSLFKRSVVGAYHQLSVKHLPAYLDEFEFRFNNRENPFIFRDALIQLMRSESLPYEELVA